MNMPVAAVTEGIQKGVVDGAMAPWEVLPVTKIDEVTKYHMVGEANLPSFGQTPLTILMNKQKYEGLPADLKAVIDKNSGATLSEMAGKVWDQGNEEAQKGLVAKGNKILIIKEAIYNGMRKAAEPVEADWIKQATARGLDGAKLAADVHAIGKKYISK